MNGSSTWGTGETPITLTGGGLVDSIGVPGASNTLTLNGTVVQASATTTTTRWVPAR